MKKSLTLFLAIAVVFVLCPSIHFPAYAESASGGPLFLCTRQTVHFSSYDDGATRYPDDYSIDIVYSYDDQGHLLAMKRSDEESDCWYLQAEYSYDEQMNLSKMIIYDAYYFNYNVNYYNDNRIDQVQNYYANGQLESLEGYFYGSLYSLDEYDYDAQGRETLCRRSYVNGLTIEETKHNYKSFDHSTSDDPFFDPVEYVCYENTESYEVRPDNGITFEGERRSYYYNDGRLLYESYLGKVYFYNDAKKLIRTECHRNSNRILEGEILSYTEYTYDEAGNLLTVEDYSQDGLLVSYEWNQYNSDGLIIEKKEGDVRQPREIQTNYEYDIYGNLITLTKTDGLGGTMCITYEYTVTQGLQIDDEKGFDLDINPDDYYDYLLCEGRDGYMLVAKRNETVKEIWYEVGVLDRDYNWIVPLSKGTTLGNRMAYYGPKDSNIGKLYYAGDDIFIYEYNNGHEMLNVNIGEWTELPWYVDSFVKPIKFCDGYLIATKNNGRHEFDVAVIVSSTGTAVETDIQIGYVKHNSGYTYGIGRYSEGLFFAYDGFYNVTGEKVIDLSEYEGQIINNPFFVNGRAVLIAINPAWNEYIAVIDHEGNFIQEFTKR